MISEIAKVWLVKYCHIRHPMYLLWYLPPLKKNIFPYQLVCGYSVAQLFLCSVIIEYCVRLSSISPPL